MPKVSVICIVYNSMKLLPQTVESVLGQTLTDFELIIVDDGSSDNAIEWASTPTDSRVRLVSQSNKGISSARNTGIEHAQGEYFAFLDGDDIWEPNKLKEQASVLDTHPEVGLVNTYVKLIDETNAATGGFINIDTVGNVLAEVLLTNPIASGSVPLVRRACFEQLGNFLTDPGIVWCDDWNMWVRIATQYQFATVQKPLTLYRLHSQNRSTEYQLLISQAEYIVERIYSGVPVCHAKLKKKTYGTFYRYIAWRTLDAQNYNEAIRLHQKFLQRDRALLFSKNSFLLPLTIYKKYLSQRFTKTP